MKAYILKINTKLSMEYAKVTADSCDNVGLPWEDHLGYSNQSGKAAFNDLKIPNLPVETYQYIENPTTGQKAMCCTAGHFAIWKRIAEGTDNVGIVLEHDAIMLQPISIEIP